jgi:hypothetical protein
MGQTLFILTGMEQGLGWAENISMETIRTAGGTMVRMADSGVVFRLVGLVGFVAAAIPAGGLRRTNFMKRKNPLRESRAEQNESAGSRAFRTDSDFAIGKDCKSLSEIATVGTEQRDIDARNQ